MAVATTGVPSSPPAGKLRPPLKWAGGKRWLLPHLAGLWEQFRNQRLVEPLCGGLAVALGLMPAEALLNDINPHAVNFYRQLRSGLQIAVEMRNDEQLYYDHRRRFNDLIASGGSESREAAALFYYLNRTGYNGLCRFNSSGRFNVPFGRYKRINYNQNFLQYSQVFARWQFMAVDFESIHLSGDDFVYADPPYDVQFTKYAKEGFGWSDQVRLAAWLGKHAGPVVLSNQATGRIIELYTDLGYRLLYLDAPRRISCTGDRSPAKEVLALKGF